MQLFLELLLLSLVAPSGDLHAGVAWCAVVCAGPASSLYSVQSSPCVACCWRQRQKVRHACAKCAKMGLFGRAGRVLYRTWGEKGPAGRVLYRTRGRASRAGRVLSRRGTALVSCCWDFVARCAAARPGHIISTGIVGLTVPSALVAVGVCSMRSWLLACRRRVGALDGVIPPDWWR